jgi:nucleoside-diphosphate-sugar epimerase
MIFSNVDKQTAIYCITGVCGFIGRSTAYHLLKNGKIVIGIDACGLLPSKFDRYIQSGQLVFLLQDFISAKHVVKQMLNKKPDCQKIFIHLAGISDVDRCSSDPSLAYFVNVQLTWEVSRFCAESGIGRCLFASTGYVYGTSVANWMFKETDALKPDNVYTATKIAAEHLLTVQSLQNEFKCVIMRFSNVYGKESSAKTVLGTIIEQARNNARILIKDPTPIRDFVYIDDIAEAILKLSNAILNESVTIVNIGTGVGTRIGDVVSIVEQLIGMQINSQKDDVGNSLVLDPATLSCLIGWIPQITVKQGLRQILTKKDL